MADSSDTTQATRALIEEAKELLAVKADKTKGGMFSNPAGTSAANEQLARLVPRLADALEAASKDTERLDWLEQSGKGLVADEDGTWFVGLEGTNVLSARAAIDFVSRAEPDTEEEDTDNGK